MSNKRIVLIYMKGSLHLPRANEMILVGRREEKGCQMDRECQPLRESVTPFLFPSSESYAIKSQSKLTPM